MPDVTRAEFLEKTKDHLGKNGLLEETGRVFYSSYATLQKGQLYVLGLNPGHRPEGYPTLKEDLEDFPGKITSDWECEQWGWGENEPGQSPLQQRMRWIVQQLGYGDMHDICASNLIFVAGRNAQGAGYPIVAEHCWPVHEMVICEIVKPSTMLVFGNNDQGQSPWHYLVSNFEEVGEREAMELNGNRSLKFARVKIGQVVVNLLGVPHLSWFAPAVRCDVDEISDWLRQHAGPQLRAF